MRQAGKSSSVDKLRMREMFVFKRTIPGKSPARTLSRGTLCATYFPNLRRKLFSYFSERNLLKLLPKNFA